MSCDGRDWSDWIERLPAELDGQRAIMFGLLDWSQHDERVRWLVVACSVGRGNADRLSDLDLGMAVTSEDFDAVVADVHQTVDCLADLVDAPGPLWPLRWIPESTWENGYEFPHPSRLPGLEPRWIAGSIAPRPGTAQRD